MTGQYGLEEMIFLREEEVFPTLDIGDASSKEEINGNGETLESSHNGKRKLQEMQADMNTETDLKDIEADKKDKQVDKKVKLFLHFFYSLVFYNYWNMARGYLFIYLLEFMLALYHLQLLEDNENKMH